MESGTTMPLAPGAARTARGRLTTIWHGVIAGRTGLAITAITTLGLALRLWGLADKSLWIDETFSIGMVTQPWGSFLHTVATVQPNMELFYLLLKVWVTVTPAAWHSGEVFWRLLPALCGAATIPATYALVRRLFGIPVALGAAALVAVNEFLIEYSQQARGYTLFVLVLTLSWLALVRWLDGERRALGWFAALTVLGFLTQAFEVVFLAAQFAFVGLVLWRRRAVPWRAAWALLPVGVVVALRYPIYAAHPDQVSWIQRPTRSDLYHGVRQLVGGDGGVPNHLGDVLVILTLLSIFVLIGWSINRLREHEGHEGVTKGTKKPLRALRVPSSSPLDRLDHVMLVLSWFVIPVAGTWLGSQVKPVWVTRYLAPCAVPACIILAVALHLVVRRIDRIAWWAFLRQLPSTAYGIALAAVMLVAAFPLHDYLARPGWEDWRGAAASVNARFAPDDGIVCYDNQWGGDFGFGYYFASLGGSAQLDATAPGTFTWATYARPDREALFAQAVDPASLAPYLAGHRRVWVLLGHYVNGAGDWRAGLAWLDAHAHRVSATIFPGDIEVYLYER